MNDKLEKAKKYHSSGEWQAAYDLYQEILRADPENLEARFYYGVLARQSGNPETAIEICKAGRLLAPDNYLFYALTGESYRDLKDYDQAIEYFNKARGLNERDVASLINLGVCYQEKDDLTQAVAHLQRAVDMMPEFGPGWTKLGIALRKLAARRDNDPDMGKRAVAAFEKALELEPRDAEAWAQLGNISLAAREMEKAAEYSLKALDLKKDEATAQNTLATVAIADGRYDEAIDILNFAAHAHPDDIKILDTLASAYEMADRPAQAREVCRRMTELRPKAPRSYVKLARLEHKTGKFEDAVAAWQKAIELGDKQASTHHELAMSLLRLDRKDEAREAFEKALKSDSSNEEAKFALAALDGQAVPKSAPAAFVTELFDNFATDFDQTLTGTLRYCTPALLYDAVMSAASQNNFGTVADIGCGTGLCGPLFRDHAERLIGSDLSPKMIEKAQARQVYDELRTEPLEQTLAERPDHFDLVLAADVFVYIGDLSEVFEKCHDALKEGGLFAFSTEEGECDDFTVNAALRYTHAQSYIESLAQKHGFNILGSAREDIRYEAGQPVKGGIFVLQKA